MTANPKHEGNEVPVMTAFVHRCPICQSQSWSKVFDVVYQVGSSTVLWRCNRCDYHFVNPRPSADYLRSLYLNSYCAHVAGCSEWGHKSLVARVRRVEEFYSKRGRLLDVGCGNGNFCLVALELGWEVYGVEPTRSAIERADPAIRKNLFEGTITDLEFPENHFDVITFWAVIEHIPDPIRDFDKAVSLLKPGGLLVFQLPHIRSLQARFFGTDWRSIRKMPDHLGFLTKRTVTYLCQKHSLRLLRVSIGGYPFPFGRPETQSVCGEELVSSKRRSKRLATALFDRPLLATIARRMINVLRIGDDIEFYIRKV